MSNLDDTSENFGDDVTGTYSGDEDNQLTVEETLDERGLEDNLDEGYSPPERYRGATAFGTTAEEEEAGETLDQRLAQEEPDPAAAFDDPLADAPATDPAAPNDQDGDPDDPDALTPPREEDEFLDDAEVGDARAGRLVAPDEGAHEDEEKDLVGGDVGIDGAGASAEEAAVHVVDDDRA